MVNKNEGSGELLQPKKNGAPKERRFPTKR
jgi:hypothetical protein